MSTLSHYSYVVSRRKLFAVPLCGRSVILRYQSKAAVTEAKEGPNTPITFSTSAAGFNYKMPSSLYDRDYPMYKRVILWGTFLFCVHYFMFFRPGNDADEDLEMPLGKRLLWVQELHLLNEKRKLMINGNSGSSVDEELQKVYDLRKKYNYLD